VDEFWPLVRLLEGQNIGEIVGDGLGLQPPLSLS
jgi:hypothetical protein